MTDIDEQGIERAKRAIGRKSIWIDGNAGEVARAAIEAYLADPPKWPTDRMVEAFMETFPFTVGASLDEVRHELRTRTLPEIERENPIVKAAVALRDRFHSNQPFGSELRRVAQVVNEAGL